MQSISWYQGLGTKDDYAGIFDCEFITAQDVEPRYKLVTLAASNQRTELSRKTRFTLKDVEPHAIIEDCEMDALFSLELDSEFLYDKNMNYFFKLGEVAEKNGVGIECRTVESVYPVYPSMTDASYAIEAQTDKFKKLDEVLNDPNGPFNEYEVFTKSELLGDANITESFLPNGNRPVRAYSLSPVTACFIIHVESDDELEAKAKFREDQLYDLRKLFREDLAAAFLPENHQSKAFKIFQVIHSQVDQTELEAVLAKFMEYTSFLREVYPESLDPKTKENDA